MRIDLHVHSLLSDGEVLPSELAKRAEEKGHVAIAITDHVDGSNLETIVPQVVRAAEELNRYMRIKVIPGVELTHLPPRSIRRMAKLARELGAAVVVVHGETPVEPVAKGTNEAALACGDVDILAHPGFLTLRQAERARDSGVYLELTSRRGHCLANGWVAKVALSAGAMLLVNTDAHAPEELLTFEEAMDVAMGAGLDRNESRKVVVKNPKNFIRELGW